MVVITVSNVSVFQSQYLSTARIESITQIGGGTRIGRAIRQAVQHFQSYGRSDAAELMIVLTDGDSNDNEAQQALRAR